MKAHRNHRRLSAAVLGALAVGSLFAGPAARAASDPKDPTAEELSNSLGDLQKQIETLKARQNALLQQQQKLEEQATLNNVLGDAEHRSRFFDTQGITAGYIPDKGFVLRSDDGNFTLHPLFLFQFRDVTNWREHGKASGANNTQNGFDFHYLKFGFDGNLFTPDFTYQFIWNTNRDTGVVALSIAMVQYQFHGTPWGVRAGQYKNPLDHEELIADQFQMANERSYLEDVMANGEGYVQAVSGLYSPGGPLRAEVAFTDGFNSIDQGFQDFPSTSADYGVAGRVEYKVFGAWNEYNHFTSYGNKQDLLVVGGGADWTEIGHKGQLLHVADVQYNIGPLGLYAAYMGRYTRGGAGLAKTDTYDPSVRLQASYLFAPKWEVFGRWGYVHFTGGEYPAGTNDNVHEITAGVNCYIHGQNAKLSCDLDYLPNGAPVSDSPSAILANKNAEFLVRAQFQLYF